MIKYILSLLSRDRLADSDDRNTVIECSSRDLTFDKTNNYQKVCTERVESLFLDSMDSAEPEPIFVALNSLSKLVKSRLGVIRFLATGEMGDLDKTQLIELFNEIDNQVEKLEDDVNNHIHKPQIIRTKAQESYRMHRERVSNDFDDFKEVY
tara:strand:+ start:288 stop:743 length:456 start_codon:yes stop_codon:yes gene_type:complete